MAKLRLFFVKEGRAAYISHLDLLRTFQRVFLREGIVLRHSQGYHPHPIISFAMPLPVGQESGCEILDFETNGGVDARTLPERLNRGMPEGIRALACQEPARPVRDLALLHCRVEFLYDGGVPDGAAERIQALLADGSLVIQKRTKHKDLAEVDIHPLLHRITVREAEGMLELLCEVSAQNPGLNPALLASAVERYLPDLAPDFVRVRRLEVLDKDGNVFR